MEIVFWGVRGGESVPDNDKVRYGGNTISAVIYDPATPQEYILLEAGTGAARFGATLDPSQPHRALMLLSHLALYQIIGFPFTPFAFSPNYQTVIVGPSTHNIALETIFDHIMSPSYSPVYGLSNLMADCTFQEANSQGLQFGDYNIISLPFEHSPESDAWGYRLEKGNRAITYLNDSRIRLPNGNFNPFALSLAEKADLLIFGTFDPHHAERVYANYDDVFDLAQACQVKQVVICRHRPSATDNDLDALNQHIQHQHPEMTIQLAYEGLQISI